MEANGSGVPPSPIFGYVPSRVAIHGRSGLVNSVSIGVIADIDVGGLECIRHWSIPAGHSGDSERTHNVFRIRSLSAFRLKCHPATSSRGDTRRSLPFGALRSAASRPCNTSRSTCRRADRVGGTFSSGKPGTTCTPARNPPALGPCPDYPAYLAGLRAASSTG